VSEPADPHAAGEAGEAGDGIARLLAIMARLRDREGGCPWDLEQTFETIVPHTLEEAHEVAEAIASGDPAAIRDELGDLLFQVVFHARLAEERGWFDFDRVAAAIAGKLERRHPHVFAVPRPGLSAVDQTRAWELTKAAERAVAGRGGALDDVALALPALTRAVKLGRRAARVGFDWASAAEVRPKLDEELGELEEALAGGESRARQEEELGDLLFAITQWARHLGLDPEAALRGTNRKFTRRFETMEQLAIQRGLDPRALPAAEWEALYVEAKARLAAAGLESWGAAGG
jgi:ATP diphosphatase